MTTVLRVLLPSKVSLGGKGGGEGAFPVDTVEVDDFEDMYLPLVGS